MRGHDLRSAARSPPRTRPDPHLGDHPYDRELTDLLRDFLNEAGTDVVRSSHLGLGGGIWKVNYRTIAEHIIGADTPESQAIFVSCTNLRPTT